MDYSPNDKTKNFIKEVQALEDNGLVKNRDEIIKALRWNKTSMSMVMNGQRDVPPHIYRLFAQVYNLRNPEEAVVSPVNQYERIIEALKGQISVLEQKSSLLEDQLTLQRDVREIKRVVEANSVAYNRLLKGILAYCKTLYLVLAQYFSKVERKPLDEVQNNMDKVLAAEHKSTFETDNS